MTKEQMFDWLVDNRISISYYPRTKWIREDGSEFYSNFIISSSTTQFGPYETLEQAIKDLNK